MLIYCIFWYIPCIRYGSRNPCSRSTSCKSDEIISLPKKISDEYLEKFNNAYKLQNKKERSDQLTILRKEKGRQIHISMVKALLLKKLDKSERYILEKQTSNEFHFNFYIFNLCFDIFLIYIKLYKYSI